MFNRDVNFDKALDKITPERFSNNNNLFEMMYNNVQFS